MSAGPRASRAPCRQLLVDLMAWLDGELTADKRREIKRHLLACECCETMAANLRAVRLLCQAEGRAQVPARVRREALARAKASLADPRGPGAARRR